MTVEEAILAVNAKHEYSSRDNGWDATPFGDCEDYSLAVIREYAGSWPNYIKTLLFGPFTFHHVKVGGVGHLVAEYKGMYFDNNYRALVSREVMEQRGFVFQYKYSRFGTLRRVLFT